MQKETLHIDQLFKTEEALKVLPEKLSVWHDLKDRNAQIDIIINGYYKPELSNVAALNYLLLEDKIPIHIIIVESSGDEDVYKKLISHEKVSKILLEDHKASHPVYGAGSYGMSVSSAVGFYFSKARYVFFSHNDMIALKKDFLGELISEMNEQTRIASFTQRHLIPFTGCMLINRNVIENSETDWLLYDDNSYIKKSKFLQKLCLLKKNRPNIKCDWIDSGEAFIYEEIANNNKVFIYSSFGGTKGLWKTPFELIGLAREKIEEIGDAINFKSIDIDKKEFKKRNRSTLKAGKKWENLKWFVSRRKNYWRYSVNEKNEIIFIHHGRGTRRTLNRWLKFAGKFNEGLA